MQILHIDPFLFCFYNLSHAQESAQAIVDKAVEIAGGSPLTEKEINATKKSEINTECPSIANPNYESY